MNTNWNDKYHELKPDPLITKCRKYTKAISIIMFILGLLFGMVFDYWLKSEIKEYEQQMAAYRNGH